MSAVLTQSHGDKQQPIGYYSKRLSTAERPMVAWVEAAVAATEAVLATADIVAMCPLTVHVPHAVLILQAKTTHPTIYTESQYAFTMCHYFHGLWKKRFLTSTGKPIAHKTLIINLLFIQI